MTSWEAKAARQVLVGILHTETTTMAWSLGLRNLIIPGEIFPVAGMPFDMARNVICHKALTEGYEWCFHLDSDVIPPRDVIPRLIARQKPLISGVYHRRSPPHGIPVMLRGGSWLTSYPSNSVIEVDLVGAGCLLIHRSVLERLPPPSDRPEKRWFNWTVDRAGYVPMGESLSEDFTFNIRCKRELGIPTLVDTSIQCRHVGFAQAGFNSMVPCETAVHT